MKYVFKVLIDNLFAIHHTLSLSNSVFVISINSIGFLPQILNVASSANKIVKRVLEMLGRSLIYSKKRTGPSTLPWGTPSVVFLVVDMAFS